MMTIQDSRRWELFNETPCHRSSRNLNDESGQFALILACGFLVILALAGLSVDSLLFGYKKATLQVAGDISTISGVNAVVGGYSFEQARTITEQTLLANLAFNSASESERTSLVNSPDYSVFADPVNGIGITGSMVAEALFMKMVPGMTKSATLGSFARQPMNAKFRNLAVGLVLDNTPWMRDHSDNGIAKIEWQRRAAIELVDRLGASDSVVLGSTGEHGGSTTNYEGCFHMDAAGKAALKSAINSLPIRGNARYGDGTMSVANYFASCAGGPPSDDLQYLVIMVSGSPWKMTQWASQDVDGYYGDWCPMVKTAWDSGMNSGHDGQEEAALMAQLLSAADRSDYARSTKKARIYNIAYGEQPLPMWSCTLGTCHPTLGDASFGIDPAVDFFQRYWDVQTNSIKPYVLRRMANVKTQENGEPYNDPVMPCPGHYGGNNNQPEGGYYETSDGATLPAVMANVLTKVRLKFKNEQ